MSQFLCIRHFLMKIMTVEGFPLNANIARTQRKTQGEFSVLCDLPRCWSLSRTNVTWAMYASLNIIVTTLKKNIKRNSFYEYMQSITLPTCHTGRITSAPRPCVASGHRIGQHISRLLTSSPSKQPEWNICWRMRTSFTIVGKINKHPQVFLSTL